MAIVSTRNLLLSSACVFALGVNGAMAGGFGLHEQSAEALGESFAGVAAGAGGLSSMFWNPATITKTPGIQTSTSLSLLIPYSSDQFVASSFPGLAALTQPGNTISPVLLPASYASYQINDQWWAGLSVTTPFGLSTKNPYGSSPGIFGLTTTIFSVNISPEIAFKVNDWISVAAGLQAMYFEARESTAVAPVAAPGVAVLRGSSWGYGFTAGVTLTPIAGTEIGIGYKSEIREGMKGNIISPTLVGGLPVPVSAPLTMPGTLTVGLRQRITPQFTLLAGVEWTNWSKVKTLTATATGVVPVGTVITTQNLNYRDGWMYSLGGEYAWDKNLTLRAGLAYEQSPITDANRSVRLLDSNRVWASIGASYSVSNKLKLDLSYAHVFYDSAPVNTPATIALPISYVGNGTGRGDIISVGLTYRWDEPKAAAVVAKY